MEPESPSKAEALLSARKLRITFDGVEAVRGLSLDVRPREVLTIVGESGAGKSLTVRALLGMPAGLAVSGAAAFQGGRPRKAPHGTRATRVIRKETPVEA